MTQEIIEMAQECGLVGMRPHLDGIYIESLLAFAKLVADKALADHAMSKVQRLGQEIEQEPVAWWNDTGTHIDLNVSGRGIPLYTTPPQRKPLTFAGQSISEIRLANGLTARFVKDILIVEFD